MHVLTSIGADDPPCHRLPAPLSLLALAYQFILLKSIATPACGNAGQAKTQITHGRVCCGDDKDFIFTQEFLPFDGLVLAKARIDEDPKNSSFTSDFFRRVQRCRPNFVALHNIAW